MTLTSWCGPASDARLVALTYELLDAHMDTIALAGKAFDELRWRAHLDYLRALQRAGREILAGSRRSGGVGAPAPDSR